MKQFIIILMLLTFAISIMAQTTNVPPLMNYQGRLSNPDGTAVADGSYKIKFSFYNQATEGTEKWYQVMEPVIVKNGVFAVLLGNGNPLSATVFEGNSFLEIKVGEDSPLTPRQPIVSVGYAFKADLAKTIPDGTVTTEKLSDGAVTSTKLAIGAVTEESVPDGSLTENKLAPGVAIPIGSLMMFCGSSAPVGWMNCDGSAVSRTTYSGLFSVIGTTYGEGDGLTSFNLPDLRQRFPLGKAASGTGAQLGEVGGIIDHLHKGYGADGGDLRACIGSGNSNAASIGFVATSGIDPNTGMAFGEPTYIVPGTTYFAGGFLNHYTPVVGRTGKANPPFIVVNYIIKY